MLSISFCLFALLASSAAASGLPDVPIPAFIVGEDVVFGSSTSTAAAAAAVVVGGDAGTVGAHYESPPCGPDEKAVQIMGIDGVFCSPMCTPAGVCPRDVPKGVTAVRYTRTETD
jgi:hypothetical protein